MLSLAASSKAQQPEATSQPKLTATTEKVSQPQRTHGNVLEEPQAIVDNANGEGDFHPSFHQQLLSLVRYFHSQRMFEDALFYAQRLQASVFPAAQCGTATAVDEALRDEALFLVADTYYQMDDIHSAYGTLRNAIMAVDPNLACRSSVRLPSSPRRCGTSPPLSPTAPTAPTDASFVPSFRCRLLLARCCHRLKSRKEAESILLSIVKEKREKRKHQPQEQRPSSDVGMDAVHHLLGTLCREMGRSDDAIQQFRQVLGYNPLSISAYEQLTALGACPTPDPASFSSTCQRWITDKFLDAPLNSVPAAAPVVEEKPTLSKQPPPLPKTYANENQQQKAFVEERPASAPAVRRALKNASTLQPSESSAVARRMNASSAATTAAPSTRTAATLVREKKRTRSGNAKTSRIEVAAPLVEEASSVPASAGSLQSKSGGSFQSTSSVKLVQLIRLAVNALAAQQAFHLREVLSILDQLDPEQQETAWVYSLRARAYFESVNYSMASRMFLRLRQLEPYRVKDMDLYSTTLWHLRREIELSTLAQELTEFHPRRAEVWCIAGNNYSLQREHESAMKCFERAIQLCPEYSYAHNLCGHEHRVNEAYDQAIKSYRNAVRFDSRMYSAWYGLGLVSYKQEKWDLAEYHIRKALQIHRSSTILNCHVGMILHKKGVNQEALLYFDKSIQLDPKNPQVKYRKALCLMDLGEPLAALKNLQEVTQLAPKEPLVYIQMGQIHKQLGNVVESLRSYLYAMDLEPKTSSMVKEAIQNLHVSEEELAQDLFQAL